MARIAGELRARYKGVLVQKDVYYRVPHGRLKLRSIGKGVTELIAYRRQNKRWGRISFYSILPVSNPKLAEAFYAAAFGRMVIVEKKRRLYLYKNARIHIDSVKILGDFIEFEVVVTKGKRQARRLLDFLCRRFGIQQSALVAVSYSDLALRSRRRQTRFH
jgi:adenylate cyclase class IV